MKPNVGEVDRNFRFVAAGALLTVALLSRLRGPWRLLALAVGISELFTATTRHCPLNEALRVDTNRDRTSKSPSQNIETPAAVI
jgi:hypothetical protein